MLKRLVVEKSEVLLCSEGRLRFTSSTHRSHPSLELLERPVDHMD